MTSFLQKTLLQDNTDDLSPDKETVAEMLQDDELTGMKINNQEEPGFEVVTTVTVMMHFIPFYCCRHCTIHLFSMSAVIIHVFKL